MRSKVINASLAIVSACLALAFVEAALRASGRFRPPDNPIRTGQPLIYQADPNIGYRLWPSKKTTYRYPPGSTEPLSLVSNSDGFRSLRELNEPDPRPRILVVGDSFVFGQGVREEDRLTEQLESLEPRWRVDNMGMTGWGVDLMIRAIESYAKKADPDVVVLAVYTDDFRRLLPYYAGEGFAYTKFVLRGSQLMNAPYPYPNSVERLRIVQLLYQTAWRQNRNFYDINEALLDRYLDDAKTIGFRPVVTFFPGKGDTEEDRERRGFLARWTARHQVPYLDLTQAIQDAGIDNVYIVDNWHWNPAGHRLAAEQLRGVLRALPDVSLPDSWPEKRRSD